MRTHRTRSFWGTSAPALDEGLLYFTNWICTLYASSFNPDCWKHNFHFSICRTETLFTPYVTKNLGTLSQVYCWVQYILIGRFLCHKIYVKYEFIWKYWFLVFQNFCQLNLCYTYNSISKEDHGNYRGRGGTMQHIHCILCLNYRGRRAVATSSLSFCSGEL
jgi:hypothetical protein